LNCSQSFRHPHKDFSLSPVLASLTKDLLFTAAIPHTAPNPEAAAVTLGTLQVIKIFRPIFFAAQAN